MTDEAIRNTAAFRALVDPHKRVHKSGKEILRRHLAGNTAGALAESERLDAASHEVLECLDRIARDMFEPATDAVCQGGGVGTRLALGTGDGREDPRRGQLARASEQ